MPKEEVTVQVLIDLARNVYMGDVRNLHIRRYKSGQNAGKLFAEYSLRDKRKFETKSIMARTIVSDLLKKAADALSEGKEFDLFIKKRSQLEEKYDHYLAVRVND